MSIFYIDGHFVPEEDAVIPANDLAVLRGYGAFDYLRTYGGRPFRLAANIHRLRRSCDLIGLDLPWSDEEIAHIVMQTLHRNDHEESNIRMVVTGGSSPDNITPQAAPRLLVMVTPLHHLPEAWYQDGVKVVTVRMDRIIPDAKSINYIPAILALRTARQHNAVEALYMDATGLITEGTTTNVFAFYGETLVTPGDLILPGITRGVILELARDVFSVEVRPLARDELLRADEIMMTAANKQVVPVVQVDDAPIGAGVVGPRVRRMMDLFRAETQRVATQV